MDKPLSGGKRGAVQTASGKSQAQPRLSPRFTLGGQAVLRFGFIALAARSVPGTLNSTREPAGKVPAGGGGDRRGSERANKHSLAAQIFFSKLWIIADV